MDDPCSVRNGAALRRAREQSKSWDRCSVPGIQPSNVSKMLMTTA